MAGRAVDGGEGVQRPLPDGSLTVAPREEPEDTLSGLAMTIRVRLLPELAELEASMLGFSVGNPLKVLVSPEGFRTFDQLIKSQLLYH